MAAVARGGGGTDVTRQQSGSGDDPLAALLSRTIEFKTTFLWRLKMYTCFLKIFQLKFITFIRYFLFYYYFFIYDITICNEDPVLLLFYSYLLFLQLFFSIHFINCRVGVRMQNLHLIIFMNHSLRRYIIHYTNSLRMLNITWWHYLRCDKYSLVVFSR